MNIVILQGRTGKKAELRTFDNGSLATFSVATNEGYYDQNKQWVDKTEWHNVVVRDSLAKRVAEWPGGIEVLVEGKLKTREYEKADKQKVKTTEIIARSVKPFGIPKPETHGAKQEEAEVSGEGPEVSDDLPF